MSTYPALADMTARRDRLAEKVGELAVSLAQAGERERRLTAALAERDAMLAEAQEALVYIAHTFTEDSHGNMKTLPAHVFQDRARAALARIDALKGGE